MDGKSDRSIYCSPLRYPGGKNCIFPFVSKLFYENAMIGVSYAEPYAGGGGLAMRLLLEGYVNHVYLNDLDPAIHAFWKVVTERPAEFCEWISRVRVTVDSWHRYKALQRSNDMFELAKSTFFLNRTNVSGVLKGGIIGGFEQRGKYKIDVRFNKPDLIRRVKRVAEMKDRITVSNLDGIDFIKSLNRRKEEVFIYMDPPYYHKGADLYMNAYNDEDHKALSRYVRTMKKQWMVSYDNQDFILGLYEGERRLRYRLSQSTSNRVGDEVLIFSKSLDIDQSIVALKMPTFV